MLNKTFTFKLSVAVAVAFGIIGACSTADESPGEVFHEYRRQVAVGLTIEEKMPFFSSRKKQEIESRIAAKDPTVSPEWDALEGNMIRCTEIKLTGESISTDVASLTYDVTSICEEHAGDRAKLRVRIVNENGWKIDEMVYAFGTAATDRL